MQVGGPDDEELNTIRTVEALIETHFPHVHEGGAIAIERLTRDWARLRMTTDPLQIRPGGTVSGPSMFKLADFSVYVIVLGALGDAAVEAVTSNLTISFLRRPEPRDLIADVRVLKLGRRLAFADVTLTSAGDARPVAHATATYAIPSQPPTNA